MPQGLQVFDASSNLTLDITDRVYRILTIADVPTTNSGTIAVAGMTTGSAVIVPVAYTPSKKSPTLTPTATGVAWNYGSIPAGDRDSGLRISVAVF